MVLPIEALERRLADRIVVDFVLPEKVKAEAPVEPEPKLAAEIVAREEVLRGAGREDTKAEVPGAVEKPQDVAATEVDLAALKPSVTIAVAMMSKFPGSYEAWNFDDRNGNWWPLLPTDLLEISDRYARSQSPVKR